VAPILIGCYNQECYGYEGTWFGGDEREDCVESSLEKGFFLLLLTVAFLAPGSRHMQLKMNSNLKL